MWVFYAPPSGGLGLTINNMADRFLKTFGLLSRSHMYNLNDFVHINAQLCPYSWFYLRALVALDRYTHYTIYIRSCTYIIKLIKLCKKLTFKLFSFKWLYIFHLNIKACFCGEEKGLKCPLFAPLSLSLSLLNSSLRLQINNF